MPMMSSTSALLPLLLWFLFQFRELQGQQAYVANKQLNCGQNDTRTLGYVCNGAVSSCPSYLTFRSNPPHYNTPLSIASLLNSDPSEIARLNRISNVINTIPADTLVIVPLNCSCTGGGGTPPPNNNNHHFYQHNSSYVLNSTSDTYFYLANNTYEGLTTCQSLIAQNSYNFRNLSVGTRLNVPLMCACPTSNQTASGVKYLLSYLVTWGNSVGYIAQTFGSDTPSVLHANNLNDADLIFPFTPILVPLKSEPTNINTSLSPPPPPRSPSELPLVPVGGRSSSSTNSSRTWVFVGVAAAFLFLLSLFLVWFFGCHRHKQSPQGKPPSSPGSGPPPNEYAAVPNNKLSSISSESVRYAVESLTLYKFADLQEATGFFAEANRIKGSSVYRASFKGDNAAVKMMKGDVSGEINILKQINHSNIIRLSGFCVHEGNTYLVYEYAANGSVSDWLHMNKYHNHQTWTNTLSWKQRVHIAYDIADALNYLHNYTHPPYIHKNLKNNNILLDGNMRAKVINFGWARTLDDNQDDGGLLLTRHVVGTYGYMAPEYIENGLITPKLDVFAFGVVMLELLSGREAAGTQGDDGGGGDKNGEEELLSAAINQVLGGQNVREKLTGFMDPLLGKEDGYPLELAYSMAQLARNCVARDLNSRPAMPEVFMTLSKILSSSLDWDPSYQLEHSRSLSHGR